MGVARTPEAPPLCKAKWWDRDGWVEFWAILPKLVRGGSQPEPNGLMLTTLPAEPSSRFKQPADAPLALVRRHFGEHILGG